VYAAKRAAPDTLTRQGIPDPFTGECQKAASASELEARHDLHLPRMVPGSCAADLAEAPAAPLETRPIEACTIEGVESLHPDLKPHILPNFKLLPQSKIGIGDSRRIQILKVTRYIAGLLVTGVGETVRFEHGNASGRAIEKSRRCIMSADSGTWARASDIGPLPAARQASTGHLDMNGLSGL
jgi:hypothetical protein